ncbi:MAG: hypothetical protein OHK0022_22130 [Roseiflexaceae bacterium]
MPLDREDALLSAVEAEIAQLEQAGGVDVVAGLRERLEVARELQAQQRQAEEFIQQAVGALGTISDEQIAELWQQVPLELEDAVLAVAEAQVGTLDQAGQPVEAAHLYERVVTLRQLQAEQHAAFQQIQQQLQTQVDQLARIDDGLVPDLWQQIPAELEDVFLAAVEAQVGRLDQTGLPVEAAHLYERVAMLRQLQMRQREQEDAPTTRAIRSFLQASTNDEARTVFAQQRALLLPFEVQQAIDNLIGQVPDEQRFLLAERVALLRTLRGAAPQPEPASALAASEHDTLTFQNRSLQVAGDLIQAGGGRSGRGG